MSGQGIANDRIETRRFVHLRYDGSDTALEVPYGAVEDMVEGYERAYRSRFGFVMPGKKVIAATISVETIGLTFDLESAPHAAPDESLAPQTTVDAYMGGGGQGTCLPA